MNAARRKRIEALHERLSAIKDEIIEIMYEEQDYLDNMPESIQSGEKGEKAQAAIDALESAESDMDSALDYLETSKE